MNVGLGGLAVGTSKFFGISALAALETAQNPSTSSTQTGTLGLVSQYANRGSITAFIQEELPKCSFDKQWTLVIDLLSSVANGLHSLHRNGINHRYVVQLHCPSPSEQLQEQLKSPQGPSPG
jgi:hypothetical protein